jgi:hypothetical protein
MLTTINKLCKKIRDGILTRSERRSSIHCDDSNDTDETQNKRQRVDPSLEMDEIIEKVKNIDLTGEIKEIKQELDNNREQIAEPVKEAAEEQVAEPVDLIFNRLTKEQKDVLNEKIKEKLAGLSSNKYNIYHIINSLKKETRIVNDSDRERNEKLNLISLLLELTSELEKYKQTQNIPTFNPGATKPFNGGKNKKTKRNKKRKRRTYRKKKL